MARPGVNKNELGGVTAKYLKHVEKVLENENDNKSILMGIQTNTEEPISKAIEHTTVIEDSTDVNANVSTQEPIYEEPIYEDPFETISHKELVANKEIVYLDVYSLEHADLETYYNHFSNYTPKKMAQLICSIIENGIMYPLIVYKEKSGRLIVLSGNHRLIAVLTIIQLYYDEPWYDENAYKLIKCIILEEEDEAGNCTSLDEARAIVLQTNIRREDTSEEEIAATLYYQKEILRRQTEHLSRFPLLRTLADRMEFKIGYVHYMLQIYENLIPELKVLYYRKKSFKKDHAILLSKLSPEIQQWLYTKYHTKKRITSEYVSQLDEQTIVQMIKEIKDIKAKNSDNSDEILEVEKAIKEYIDSILDTEIKDNEKIVEIKHKIPKNVREVAKRTLDEIASAATNLTEGNTLMAMMCEVPKDISTEDIRNRCLEAMLNIINEAKETGI